MKYKGFTLIELIITIAIAAIMLTMVGPSFVNMIVNNRLASQANALVSTLNLARSEAVKQGRIATVCASKDQATCTALATTCPAGSGWSCGWLVWIDTDGDSTLDDGEAVRAEGPIKGTGTLTGTVASQQYLASGATTAASTFTLCDNNNNKKSGRQIEISVTGRVSTSHYTCP